MLSRKLGRHPCGLVFSHVQSPASLVSVACLSLTYEFLHPAVLQVMMTMWIHEYRFRHMRWGGSSFNWVCYKFLCSSKGAVEPVVDVQYYSWDKLQTYLRCFIRPKKKASLRTSQIIGQHLPQCRTYHRHPRHSKNKVDLTITVLNKVATVFHWWTKLFEQKLLLGNLAFQSVSP